ncbi:Pre-mRNA-splicing factor [Linnemannia schmuckeri]|uniref:Pre-mRNA-splicing factor n=1 Tax=Linnemannia schmuckeri TaxID=64567 RepID=A0A9P5S2N0_9FUNG|nr:Pre-mRNA-splicing factor [Linnemannia schmuckeri]
MASPADATSRPARKQVAKNKVLGPQASGPTRGASGGGKPGQTYNIYYDKWTGGPREDRSTQSKEKSPYRCDPVKDTGRTKGTYNPNAYFCAFFAKGCCPNGEDCGWLHRIPTRQDQADTGKDVFGRERFDEHRDDRGGVGSMRSDSKTLYVGRIHPSSATEAIIEKHFRQWGELERVKVLKDKGIGFVTYRDRLNAEFAKEAMANQSLDYGEIVNIRWATEDPNPKMQMMNKRKAVEMTRQAIESKLPEEVVEAENRLEDAQAAGIAKRSKQESTSTTISNDPAPTLYQGADGQYYYDYGEYGYNHETQQYDPARLAQYQGRAAQSSATPLSLQDRVKASLQSTATTSVTAPPVPAKVKETKPPASALGALAAYGSDSEDDDQD